MTEKELSKRMRTEYEKEMPDMLSGIESACADASQVKGAPASMRPRGYFMRYIGAVAAGFLIFFGGLFTGTLLPKNEPPAGPLPTQTVVYMDVNPSVELRLDENGRVLQCIAGNEDAKKLLSGLELVGVERDTALTAVLGSMYLNGYLDNDNNAVLISVDGADGDTELGEITDKINEVFSDSGMSCSIIAQSLSVEDELSAQAQEYGVSPGKLYLAKKLVHALDSLDEADLSALAEMSVRELNLLYTTSSGEAFDGDIVSGIIGGYMSKEDVVIAILQKIGQSSSLLEEYQAITDYEEFDGERKLVYIISMRFKYSDNFYSFTIDCESGELLETDFELNFPW